MLIDRTFGSDDAGNFTRRNSAFFLITTISISRVKQYDQGLVHDALQAAAIVTVVAPQYAAGPL